MIIEEEVEVEEKFEPFKIKITVQTEGELFALYHRLNNGSFDDYFERNDQFKKMAVEDFSLGDFYAFINTKINTMNLANKLLGE